MRDSGRPTARAAGDAAEPAAAKTEAAVAVSHALRRLALSAVEDGQFRREHFESVVYDHAFATAAEGVAYVVLGNPLYPPLTRRRPGSRWSGPSLAWCSASGWWTSRSQPPKQNAKLRLVETLARYYWGNEI